VDGGTFSENVTEVDWRATTRLNTEPKPADHNSRTSY